MSAKSWKVSWDIQSWALPQSYLQSPGVRRGTYKIDFQYKGKARYRKNKSIEYSPSLLNLWHAHCAKTRTRWRVVRVVEHWWASVGSNTRNGYLAFRLLQLACKRPRRTCQWEYNSNRGNSPHLRWHRLEGAEKVDDVTSRSSNEVDLKVVIVCNTFSSTSNVRQLVFSLSYMLYLWFKRASPEDCTNKITALFLISSNLW